VNNNNADIIEIIDPALIIKFQLAGIIQFSSHQKKKRGGGKSYLGPVGSFLFLAISIINFTSQYSF